MKKIALLLSIVFVLSVVFSACEKAPGDNSSQVSNTSDTSDNSETSDNTEIKGVNTNVPVSDSAYATVISEGASYTVTGANKENADKYPDSYGGELTDGMRVIAETATYSDSSFVGYNVGYSTMNITVDLGYVCDKVYQFKLSYLASTVAGSGAPDTITARVSDNGKIFVNKGAFTKPEFEEGTVQEAVLTVDEYLNVRYIRFTIISKSTWIFLDELQVIADIESTNSSLAYLDAVNSAYDSLGALSAPVGGNDIDRELTKTLISSGASYQVTGTGTDLYPDSGKKLTDGVMTGYYEGGSWVGYEGNQDIVATVDLGKEVKDIATVEASFFVNTATQIYLPVAVKITAISNDKKRTDLGVLYGNAYISSGNYVFSLPLSNAVSARNIEFTFISTDCKLHLVEELAVFAYREKVSETLYPDVVIETDDGSWKSGSGFEYKNLILGMNQQIIASSDPGKENYKNNTSVESTLMTDGVLSGDTGIHNNKFFKFNGGGDRKIIYDLQNIAAVDKFEASFTNQTDWAVYAPAKTLVYVSNNGSDWYEAGIIEFDSNDDPGLHRGSLKLSKKVQARYVVFVFDVKGWCGCDELSVYGTNSSSGAVAPAKAGLTKKSLFEGKRTPPSDDLMGGAKDLCLLYHCKDSGYTEEDLLPYVAYLDEDGNIKDIMFDSALFLHQNSSFPSGAKPHIDGLKSDWEWVIDDLFTENENIIALEKVVGKAKAALNLPDDYKYKVAVTLYYPSTTCTNFGDVDGDGVSENFSNYKDRIKAIQWFINETEKRFAECNFENIELVAYYWWHEEINRDDTDSLKMLNEISDIVHENDRDFIWIPYFTANGYNKWADYGFDYAVMQPNYVFTAEAPYSNVENCANLTALYGMGVEMELFEDVLSKELFFKKYMQYIAGGAEYGYMDDCVIMYYQSVFTIRDAAYSDKLMARIVYEQTYHFIKGDLEYKPDTLSGLSFNANKNTPATLDLGLEDGQYQFAVSITPDHGSVTLNGDGTITYYPETDYTGEVKFSFTYSEYLGWSDPCEVTITVK